MNPPSGVTTSPNARLTKQSRRPRESSRGWLERTSLTQLPLHGSEDFPSSADRPAIFFSFISLRTIHFFTQITHGTLDDREGVMTEDDGKECDSGGCARQLPGMTSGNAMEGTAKQRWRQISDVRKRPWVEIRSNDRSTARRLPRRQPFL